MTSHYNKFYETKFFGWNYYTPEIVRDENIFNFSTLPTFQLKNTKIPQKIIAKTPEEIINITNKV